MDDFDNIVTDNNLNNNIELNNAKNIRVVASENTNNYVLKDEIFIDFSKVEGVNDNFKLKKDKDTKMKKDE